MSGPTPISDSGVSAGKAFLSTIVVRVFCSRCHESTPILGALHQALVLGKHREHLGKVIVEVWFEDPINKEISEMQLSLLPIQVQATINILSVN